MTWTLAEASIATSGDRYEVAFTDDEYYVVHVNGQRPSAFRRTEAAALEWIANRELAAARRRLGADAVCDARFTFTNDDGERSSFGCTRRSCARPLDRAYELHESIEQPAFRRAQSGRLPTRSAKRGSSP